MQRSCGILRRSVVPEHLGRKGSDEEKWQNKSLFHKSFFLSSCFCPLSDYRYALPCPVHAVSGIEPRALWEIVIVIPSTNRVSTPVHISQVASSNYIRLSMWNRNCQILSEMKVSERLSLRCILALAEKQNTRAPKSKPLPSQWLI